MGKKIKIKKPMKIDNVPILFNIDKNKSVYM